MEKVSEQFTPKLFTLLKAGISKTQLVRDLVAGTVVGVVALPLAIAFAIASGVSPEKGLVTAIFAGLFIAVFGGSRVQIGGPTGAFIIIVLGIVQQHGVVGLTTATFMAGILIILMGLARLGDLLKFIPLPLIVGFTSGIAVVIFSTQIKDFFGLPVAELPGGFFEKWVVYFSNLEFLNPAALLLGISSLVVTLFSQKIFKRIPGALLAIIFGTLTVFLLELPVETIESRFGNIPNRLPAPGFPALNIEVVQQLIGPAFAIALLGAIESLLSAVVADGMIGGNHRSNMELIAQGGANIVSALFGGIPATGAIARTVTNVKNGGRTPIAGMVHALVLLMVMLLFAPLAGYIPLPVLAGILVAISWHMAEWQVFKNLLKSPPGDKLVLLVTFFLTVIFDLVIAIEVGMVLSSLVFMKRMSEMVAVEKSTGVLSSVPDAVKELFEDELPNVPADVLLYEIKGPLFFGAAQKFMEALLNVHEKPSFLVLRMRQVPFVDATGLKRLEEIIRHFQKLKVTVLISGVNPEVKAQLHRSGIADLIGQNNLLPDILHALRRVTQLRIQP